MERYRPNGLKVILKDGDIAYNALIRKSDDEGGYVLIGFIRKEKANNMPFLKKKEENVDFPRFPNAEAFDVVERLVKLGYVTEGGEFGGQFRVMFDDDLNLRFDKHYDRPGRPYPKNAEEFRLRLKGKF